MSTTVKTEVAYDLKKRAELQKEADGLMGKIVVKLMSNPKGMDKMLPVMEAVMTNWAGDSRIKKFIVKTALKKMPKMAASMGKKIDDRSIAAELGTMLKLKWMIAADKNRENPTAKADSIGAPLRKFFGSVDFSEFKEMIDTKKEGSIAMSKALNEVIMDYPTKLVAIASALPTIVSTMVNSSRAMVQKTADVSPDFMFEAMMGFARAINGKEIGQLLNDRNNSTWMRHTGSLLAGDGTIPAMQQIVMDKLREIIPELNPEIYGKMKRAKAEDKGAVKNGVSEVLKEFPEFTKKVLSAQAAVKNAEMRALRKRLKVLEEMTQDDMAEVVTANADKFDTLELADVINSLLLIINSMHESKPGLIPGVLSSVATAVDIDEIEKAGNGIIKESFEAIKPAAGAMMPALINGLCDLLTPEPGQDSGELEEALSRLSDILGGAK